MVEGAGKQWKEPSRLKAACVAVLGRVLSTVLLLHLPCLQ